MEPAFRPAPLSLSFSKKERAKGVEIFFFSQGVGVNDTIAGRIDAVTLSYLETGAFQLKLRMKSAFLSIAPPPPRDEEGNPASPGTFSRSVRTFDAVGRVRERVRVLRKRFFSQRGQSFVCLYWL